MPLDHKVGDPYPTQRARPLGLWIDKPRPALRNIPESNRTLPVWPAIQLQHTRELSLPPSLPISTLKRPQSLPGTQEHSDASGPEKPRSTQMPLDQEDPGVTRRYWTKKTQEHPRRHWTRKSQKHPKAFRPRGPRSTQTALDKEDSRAPRPHWTKRPTLAPLSKAEMGRRQCKSTYNTIKDKTTPESSPPSTPRPDHCNIDKTEENDLKKSLMKMLEEAFEEKMKNVNKEIGGKHRQKIGGNQ
ncbi:hypothetical protein STEG23_006887 [Scotinomys teguina]